MLHAKEPGMERVFVASIVGIVAAVITLIPLNIFVKGIDPNVMLILNVAIVFLVSSMAFKYINVMTWGGAVTTNIANIVLSLIGVTASVILTGGSINDTVKAVSNVVKENTGMVENVTSGNIDSIAGSGVENNSYDNLDNDEAVNDQELVLDDDVEPVIKEIDLLPEGTIRALKAKEKKVYREPKYHVVSIASISGIVGKNIRILNKNGKSITGSLKKIIGNDAVIEQRIGGGLATTPVSLAKIRKLEVYR